MDGQNWMWRRESSNNSTAETESSGSLSSRSGRYSDEQDVSRASLSDSSPKNVPEVLSNISDIDAQEAIQTLSQKLSAALLELAAKECLVKQHAKVAEEAVSGWEKAEIEVTALKQQLEAAAQKNSILDHRTIHLDEALKECVKKLRQCREEQEQRIHDALNSKSLELETCKAAFENKLVELQAQLEASKSEALASVEDALRILEKENLKLTMELHARLKDLEMLTIERDFCIRSAESASKQNLESIKKVSKLEAECRKLQNVARMCSLSPASSSMPLANSICMESSIDSLSGLDEPLLAIDGRLNGSDSWASALITELDQFKNKKAGTRNITTSVKLDMMDDFLEMERLVALPDIEYSQSTIMPTDNSDKKVTIDVPPKITGKPQREEMNELVAKVNMVETEKEELEVALVHTRAQLERTRNLLMAAESRLVDLQWQLDFANESKTDTATELEVMESRWKESDSQLVAAQIEIGILHEKSGLIESQLEDERALSASFSSKAGPLELTKATLEAHLELAHADVNILNENLQLLEANFENGNAISAEFEAKIEALEATMKALEFQLESANLDCCELHDKVSSLSKELEEDRKVTLENSIKLHAMEMDKKELELQIESTNLEVTKLLDKAKFLEKVVESTSSALFSGKCQTSKIQVARKNQGDGERSIKQEKGLSTGADKLADCQKTIALICRQLKSLTNFDEFMFDASILECDASSSDGIESNIQDLHASYS